MERLLTIDSIKMITAKSKQAGLPPEMILAIIEAESNGNPYAAAYYANYSWLNMQTKRPVDCHPNTESAHQRMAWGLMQIIGATARDMGFEGWLTELTDPVANIAIGMKYLASLSKKYMESHGIDGVIAACNARSPKKTADGNYRNQAYVDKVKNLMLKYAALIPEEIKQASEEMGKEAEPVKPVSEVTDTAGAETEDLSKMTKDELMKKAEELGIAVPLKTKKEEVVALIIDHTTGGSTTKEG